MVLGARTAGVSVLLAPWPISGPFLVSIAFGVLSSRQAGTQCEECLTCLGYVLTFMSLLVRVHSRLGGVTYSCHPSVQKAEAT